MPGQTMRASSSDARGDGNTGRGGDGKYRRPGLGVLAGLGVFLLVAIPAGTSAYLSLLSFTGACFFAQCAEPEPGVGATWAALAMFLLALPFAMGLFVARVPLRRGWPWLVGFAGLLVLGVTYAQRVM